MDPASKACATADAQGGFDHLAVIYMLEALGLLLDFSCRCSYQDNADTVDAVWGVVK